MACLVKYSQNAAWHLTLQLPTRASHVAFSQEPLLANFLWASRKTTLIFIVCLILYQLNTKLNTIKSHKIRGNKLVQLQHILSWNKAKIKHNCKSQLYNIYIYIYISIALSVVEFQSLRVMVQRSNKHITTLQGTLFT